MKKLILLAVCWLLNGICFAQQDSTFVGRTQASYDSIFSELDWSKITTGVLVDKTLILSDLAAFDGTQDTISANFSDWRQMYLEFYNSTAERGNLRALKEVVTEAYNFINENHKFPLMLLAYDYNKIMPEAVENGLIEIDSVDTYRVYDRSTNNEELYSSHQLFTVSLPIKKWNGETLPIYIGEEFWFGNMPLPDKIEIDFGDGRGFIPVEFGQTYNIQWENAGAKLINVRIDKWILNTLVNLLPDLYIMPDYALGVVATKLWPNYSPAKAMAWVKFGNGNTSGKFRKPLVFVEGIDFRYIRPQEMHLNAYFSCIPVYPSITGPMLLADFAMFPCGRNNYRYGEAGWNEMYYFNEEYKSLEKLPSLRSQLVQQGYDVIYFDFADGADLIQNNAMALIELLEWINDPSHRTADSKETIVMGASMGGQVARFALAWMEERNLCHNTRLYVSFDSPHRGANVPLGLQHLIVDLASLSDAAELAKYDLLRPAAKQMLVLHNNSGATPFRNDWQVWQNSANSYPQNLRKIAVANGSRLMVPSTLNPGARIAETNAVGSIVLGNKRCFALRGQTMYNHNNVIYRDGNGLFSSAVTKTADPSWPEYDSAPGCIGRYPTSLDKGIGGPLFKVHKKESPFMPTISTLDVRAANPSNNYLSNVDLLYNIDANILPSVPDPTKYPFDAYFAPDENEPHVQITDGTATQYPKENSYPGAGHGYYSNNIAWLMGQLQLLENSAPHPSLLPVQTTPIITLFNFGSPLRNQLRSINIQSGGELYVNKQGDVTGITPIVQTVQGTFQLNTIPGCPAVVQIQPNGKMVLGDDTNPSYKAEVFFKSNSRLELNGGRLVINDGSRLVIEAGATLELTQNSIIELNGDNAVLEIKGRLIVGPNTTFTFTAAPGQNTGYIRFDRDYNFRPEISVTNTSHLKFEGKGRTDKILEIAPGTWLTYNNWEMGSSEFKNGLVEMGAGSKVYLVQNVTVDNVHFNGVNGNYNAVESYAHADRERISNSKFTNGEIGLISFLWMPLQFKMSGNLFDICSTGFKAYNSHIEINNCHFYNTNTGFEMIGGGAGEIKNSLFDGCENGIVYNTANGILNLENTMIRNGNDGLRFSGGGTIKGFCSTFSNNLVGVRAQNSAYIDYRKTSTNIVPGMSFGSWFDNIVLENASGLNFENGANNFSCYDLNDDYNAYNTSAGTAGIRGSLIQGIVDNPANSYYNPAKEFDANDNQWNNIVPAQIPVAFQDVSSSSRFDYKVYIDWGGHPHRPYYEYFKIIDDNPRSINYITACNSGGGTGSRLSSSGLTGNNIQSSYINSQSKSGSGQSYLSPLQLAIDQAVTLRRHQNTTGDDQQAFMVLHTALQQAQPDTSAANNVLIGIAYRLIREIYSAALISDSTTTPAAKLALMNQINDKVINWQQLASNYKGLFYTNMNKVLDTYSSGDLLQARAHLGLALPFADSAGQIYAQYWNCLISANILLKDSTITMQQFFAMLDSCSGFNAPPTASRTAAISKQAAALKKQVQEEKPISVYPNPSVTGEAMLSYELRQDDEITVELLDVKGNVVKTVQKQSKQKAGAHEVAISIHDRAGGLYLVRVYGRHFNKQTKFVYQK